MKNLFSLAVLAALTCVAVPRAEAFLITNYFDTDPGWTGFNNMAPE